MSLPTNYGIELSLLLQSNSDWNVIYTYYNHGLEPPHGGVKSDAVGGATWTVKEANEFTPATNLWIDYIVEIMKVPRDHNPDLPLEHKLEVSGGDLILSLMMETLDMEVRWEQATGNVVFADRDAFDLSWEGFLYYKILLDDFMAKINEQ